MPSFLLYVYPTKTLSLSNISLAIPVSSSSLAVAILPRTQSGSDTVMKSTALASYPITVGNSGRSCLHTMVNMGEKRYITIVLRPTHNKGGRKDRGILA